MRCIVTGRELGIYSEILELRKEQFQLSYERCPAIPRLPISRTENQDNVHPISVGLWKKTLLERGAEIFAGDSAKQDYERRIAELEQLLGKKEVEIALLKNFLRRTP